MHVVPWERNWGELKRTTSGDLWGELLAAYQEDRMEWDGEQFRYAHSQKKIHPAPTVDQALYQAWG